MTGARENRHPVTALGQGVAGVSVAFTSPLTKLAGNVTAGKPAARGTAARGAVARGTVVSGLAFMRLAVRHFGLLLV